MARKNAYSSPGVWLGLLLVLVAHTLARSTSLENVPEYVPIGDDAKDFPDGERFNEDSAKFDAFNDGFRDMSEKKFGKLETSEITTTIKSEYNQSTPSRSEAESTVASIDHEKHPAKNDDAGKVENTEGTTESEKIISLMNSTAIGESSNDGKSSTPSHLEFDPTEEQDNFEEHANSEFAEATTPPSKLQNAERQKILEDSLKNIDHSGVEKFDDHHLGNMNITISLENDTRVNDHKHAKNFSRRFEENDTSISIINNGENLGHGPKHDVEIFKTSSHPTVHNTSEGTGEFSVVETTTPYFTNTSRPKSRTIPITAADYYGSTTKKPKNFNHSGADQSTSSTIMRIVPKKLSTTEKPNETKPYPYHKSSTISSDHEIYTENLNKTEESTERISSFENTISGQKSGEDVVPTEPSVLENSIQQFKPIHYKRSGNSSRINSTIDRPISSTAWSLPSTEELMVKNGTEVIQESQTIDQGKKNRSQINNDVPQDNLNQSVTTIRSVEILPDVTVNNIETVIRKINDTYNPAASISTSTKLTERFEITAEVSGLDETRILNSTEKIETVSVRSSTSGVNQTENGDSEITQNQLNVTESFTEYPISGGNFSTTISTEIESTKTSSNTIEKLIPRMETTVSSPITISTTTESDEIMTNKTPTSESSETKPAEDNSGNVTKLETVSENRTSTKSIMEPTTSQTTNIEYEFVELTTPESSSTISHADVSSSDKMKATTDFSNETTVSPETVTTDSSIEQNETTFSRNIETVDPVTPALTTTPISDTTIIFDSEMTTTEDSTNPTNSPVSESNFTTVTDIHDDTTLSSTSFNDNTFHGRVDAATTGISHDPEEINTTIMTETIPPTEEPTTISNIEVIVFSESTTTPGSLTTVSQATTLQIHSTSELPEFTVANDDVTLYISVIIEGSWSEVCPFLPNLRQLFASILTVGTDSTVLPRNIILHQTQCSLESTPSTTLTPVVLYVVDDNGNFDYTMTEMLPTLYRESSVSFPLTIRSVEKLQTESSNNAIAVVAVSCVAFICLVLLAGLLFIMRKRQTRFNYGERCRPVSLDAFRVDSVSAYNSVRRKGLTRASKRSYGNPAFEDSSVTPSHPLNFAGLSSFCNDSNAITEEFEGIPQVTARMDELPAGAEVKNRYANVAPLPETRVLLQKINNEPLTEYINASYVRGPKNATKYYIACQAPMESTVSDFWRMIWEQQSKVIIMLTDIVENGVEKCVEYIPPSEVTDCHRLYGDYQVTLKKREAKEKYAISTLHLKNLENNTYREVSHIWYLWPTNGVPSNGTGLIAILLEARALQRGAPGPIVVHCSPGTGRTGTLIALDLGIRQYEITRTVDVPRVVYTIRRDRAGAVQTKEQYAFIYKALNLYAAKLAGGALESM